MSKINIAIFFSILYVFLLMFVILPKGGFSEDEGRELSAMPDFSVSGIISEELPKKYDDFISDNFPFRTWFINTNGYFSELYGIRGEDEVKIHAPSNPEPIITIENSAPAESPSEPLAESPAEPIAEPPAEPPSEPPELPKEDTSDFSELDNLNDVGVATNGIFTIGGKGMSIYGGATSVVDYYAETISSYAESWEGNAKVFNLIIPTAIEFYLPEKYQNVTAPQIDAFERIENGLSPLVTFVDSYNRMKDHTNEKLYFATDHHWTALGAYYAYTAFCESAGLTPIPLEDFEKRERPPFVGSLFRYTQDVKLKENPDKFDYYVPKTEHSAVVFKRGSKNSSDSHTVFFEYASDSNTYSLFLGGDHPLVEITTNANTGKSIAMVKESFGNAFAPFLINHYDKIYVIDQRYFEKNFEKFVTDNKIDHVLFINNVIAASTSLHVDWIKNLRTEKVYQSVSQPVVPANPQPQTQPVAPAVPQDNIPFIGPAD